MNERSMRIATFNIRNIRALDIASLWLFRRRKLAAAIRTIDVDVWALQEACPSQIRWLQRTALLADEWHLHGDGRSRRRRGEATAVFTRRDRLTATSASTRWLGPTPSVPGSRLPGATAPRIATIVDAIDPGGNAIRILNTHLDEKSARRRASSLEQVVQWAAEAPSPPSVIVGDLNCTPDDPEFDALTSAGFDTVLTPADGSTSNRFGKGKGRQIDHILVTDQWEVADPHVAHSVGLVSDHYPVIAELAVRSRSDEPAS